MHRTRNGLIGAALGVGLLGASGQAHAGAVTYDVYVGTNSYATILAQNSTNNNTLVNNASISLTHESYVQFDNGAMTLPGLELINDGSVALPITAGTFAGDSFVVTDLTLKPGSSYSSSVSSAGGGTYGFSLSELAVTGSWQIVSGSTTLAHGNINATDPTLNGTFTVSGSRMQNLTLSAISLGTVDSGAINLSAGVDFNGGTVPLPATVWLLGSGLAGLLLLGVRRRQQEGSPSHAL